MTELDQLIKDIASQMQATGETFSLAESCTGGLLSAQVTNLPGVSSVYIGGVVSYANFAKETLLSVPADLLLNHGAVSREVALAMAHGVRLKLRTSWSLAITGIAGPTGGTPDKPVGTVWFAVAGPGFVEAERQHFQGDRLQVRLASAKFAMQMFKRALK